MASGTVFHIIEKAARIKSGGQNIERTKLILKMRLTTQTGLNIQEYTPHSEDQPEQVNKVLEVIRGPMVGLRDFSL
jgi:hypothetical protein